MLLQLEVLLFLDSLYLSFEVYAIVISVAEAKSENSFLLYILSNFSAFTG